VNAPGVAPLGESASLPVDDASRADLGGPDRVRALVEVGILLGSELTLESLLQRLIRTAVELTGARYGAMGVIDSSGLGLDQFITVGMEPELVATIGDLPRGRGILGVPIREHKALRLRRLGEDPRSVGFPPGHPPMGSFLGVPVMLRGTAFGNLYLTEKAGGGEFTDEDEDIVRLLAAQAAGAIENARLYESARQWSNQLESLNEISTALASETDLSQLFQLATSRLRQLIGARVVMLQLPTADGDSLSVEVADGENAAQLVGLKFSRARSKSGLTLSRKRSERIDALIDDPEVDQTAPRLVDATSALYVPLVVRERAAGVIVVYDKQGLDHRFTDGDMRIAQAFANRVAVAIDLSERVGRQAVNAILDGQERERTRLARELHDEAGQALASILLGLRTLEQRVGSEPVAEIRELVVSALDNIRGLTVELRPPALDDFGLEPALERLTQLVAARSDLSIHLSVSVPDDALASDQETAIYRIVQEALTNIVKHAHANQVSVVVTATDGTIRTVIEDDGDGFNVDTVRDGALGLVGMRERVMLLGGRFAIESTTGGGTTLVLELPASR
jgi:signal transduction histidine kinase